MRVLTWNIAKGRHLDGDQAVNSQLRLIAQRINEQQADLALLNEVKNWHWPFALGLVEADQAAAV